MNFKLDIKELKGNNTKALSAFVNAIRAGNFINFLEHFDSELGNFFENVDIYESLEAINNNQKKALNIAYKNLKIAILQKVYDEVFAKRKEELEFLFEEKEVIFSELSNLDKLRYTLLRNYGDKLGGYLAIASMSIEELIRTNKIFCDLEKEERKQKQGKR